MYLSKILNNRIIIVFVAPFILGSLSVLSFQPFNIIFVNFLIIPGIFLLLTYVNKKSKNIYRKKPFFSNLFFVGHSFGVGFFLFGTYWIAYSLTFDESFKFLIPFSLILIPLFLGTFFGIATLIVGPFITNNFSSILIFINSLAAVDYLRGKIFTGFPWNVWAYSWSWLPETIQVINFFGLYAFNLLSITFFCMPLFFFTKIKINMFIPIILVTIFFMNFFYGSYKINKNKEIINAQSFAKNEVMNFKIVNPNFKLEYNLSEEEINSKIEDLIKYSDPDNDKNTIFIWPEGAFIGYNLVEINNFKKLFQNAFSDNHLIVFGINTIEKNSNRYFNSFIVVNKNLEVIYQYNKKKLVPFGEFLPYEKTLKKIGLKKITKGHTSFTRGNKQENLYINNFNITPLICYEIIFPELIQRKKNVSNLIINISEDAWFGGSIGPYQHFAKAIFRAVENNTFVARAANQGVSAFISNTGIVLKKLEPNERGNIEFDIPLINNNLRNKNDLIFFVLLFTYTLIFFTIKKKINDKK
jgi:apolipoprotein N-acyltransferase